MDELDSYQGLASRTCPECGLTITVEHPTRVLSRSSNRAWRKKARQETARQIAWEFMCDSCRAWWNAGLRRLEQVPVDDDGQPFERVA